MRPLENILDLDQYTALMSEGKDPHSSIAGWEDCVLEVEKQILLDRTTTKENLREKIKNYALNYMAVTPELSAIDKDKLIEDLADEIEDDLKHVPFDQRTPANVIAQEERDKIPEAPENKYIKLSP